ncbi:MAG: hypothetical protein ACRCZD_21910, partial [Phycicoccus sp.]
MSSGTDAATAAPSAPATTAPAPSARAAPAAAPARPLAVLVLSLTLGAVAVAAAVVSGPAMTRGDRLLTVIPLALMVGLAVGVLALTRFRAYVLLLLAIRPSVDL